MAGRDERLSSSRFEMCALVWDEAVATSRPGRIAVVRDDGMGLDFPRESKLFQAREKR